MSAISNSANTYGLPIRAGDSPGGWRAGRRIRKLAFTDDGIVENSGEYSGLPSAEARQRDESAR